MGAESKFWNKVAEAFAPGWQTVVDRSVHEGKNRLSGVDTFIYVMDTHSGWIGVAGISRHEALKVVLKARSMPQVMASAGTQAIDLISSMHDRKAVAGDSDTREAVIAGTVAFASTRTLDVVLERQGHLAGHFLYLVHTPRNGRKFGRPVFRTYEQMGVMPTDIVLQTAADVIELDANTVGGSVGRDIKAAGGLILCTELVRLVNQERDKPSP